MGIEVSAKVSHPHNQLGQFAKVESEIRDLMRQQSRLFQEEVAQEINSSIGTKSGRWQSERKIQSSGRLARTTLQDGNRDVTPLTWKVGKHSFLNRSNTKYWRTFEEGSLGAGWSFRGRFVRFNPAGFPASRGSVRPFRSFPASATVFPRGIKVNREIEGHHTYSKVWNDHRWPERIQREFKTVLTRNL